MTLDNLIAKAKSRLPSATNEAKTKYIIAGSDVLEDVLTECRAVAKAADEHAADAKRLIDAWPE